MKEFTNKTAREIFLDSLKVEQSAQEQAKRDAEEVGVMLDSTADIFQAAAGLRSLADSVEYGEIDEDIAKDYEDEILL